MSAYENVAIELEDKEALQRARKAVRKLRGTVTVSDLVQETGMPTFEAERALKTLLAKYEGHLRVSEQGDLIYAFNPSMLVRDRQSALSKVAGVALKIGRKAVELSITVVLFGYMIVYLLLLVFIVIAGSRSNNSSSSSGGGLDIGRIVIWYYAFVWHPERLRVGRGRKAADHDEKPFYVRVNQYVLGPEKAKEDKLAERKLAADLIRHHKGVISIEDWMFASGLSRKEAESKLARYTAEFDGNVEISDDGQMLYVFEKFMRAHRDKERVSMRGLMCWMRSVPIPKLTGDNTKKANTIITAVNLFNLIFSLIIVNSPSLYMAYLMQMSEGGSFSGEQTMGILAQIGSSPTLVFLLGWVPLFLSLLFFILPIIRRLGIKVKQKAAIAENNRQQVVKIMCNAAGQSSQCLHFL